MTSEQKIELLKELLKDHKKRKISSFAAMVALQLIVDPKKPSKECTQWARRSFENRSIYK